MRRLKRRSVEVITGANLTAMSVIVLVSLTVLFLMQLFLTVSLSPEEVCQFWTSRQTEDFFTADLVRLVLLLIGVCVVFGLADDEHIQSALQAGVLFVYVVGFEGTIAVTTNLSTPFGRWMSAAAIERLETLQREWSETDPRGVERFGPRRVQTSCGVLPPKRPS